jgi:hypothetical protein
MPLLYMHQSTKYVFVYSRGIPLAGALVLPRYILKEAEIDVDRPKKRKQ